MLLTAFESWGGILGCLTTIAKVVLIVFCFVCFCGAFFLAGSVGNRQYALVWYIIAVGLGIFCLILASIISIISDKHDIDADTMNYGHTIGWGSWEPGGIL